MEQNQTTNRIRIELFKGYFIELSDKDILNLIFQSQQIKGDILCSVGGGLPKPEVKEIPQQITMFETNNKQFGQEEQNFMSKTQMMIKKAKILFESGFSMEEVASKLNRSVKTLYNWGFTHNGYKGEEDGARPTELKGSKYLQMFREGIPTRQIARIMGVGVSTVSAWYYIFVKRGLIKPKRQIKEEQRMKIRMEQRMEENMAPIKETLPPPPRMEIVEEKTNKTEEEGEMARYIRESDPQN